MNLVACPTPIPVDDLRSIQQMLATENAICSAFKSARFDAYNCFGFLEQKLRYGVETCFIIDRNIFTRIISLTRGEAVPRKTKEAKYAYRLAAGALAFFQCCDALVEPCLPLLEQSSHDNNKTSADEELRLFRIADNVAPQNFADIALGKSDHLDLSSVKQIDPDEPDELSEKPMWWTLNYALALKLALLELEQIDQRTKLERFLQWLHEDYIWSASAVMFAIVYLSPLRKRGMLKRLRSPDRRVALDGVRNAVWDMTLLTMWSGNCHAARGSKKVWFLCSRDQAVGSVAGWLVSTESNDERLKQIYMNCWGEKNGLALVKYYFDLSGKLQDSTRRIMRVPKSDPIWSRIPEELEHQFLERLL